MAFVSLTRRRDLMELESTLTIEWVTEQSVMLDIAHVTALHEPDLYSNHCSLHAIRWYG